jgi:hypothetical protein
VNASGDVIELLGTAMDITERKRAEAALRESETSLLEAQRLTRSCSWPFDLRDRKLSLETNELLSSQMTSHRLSFCNGLIIRSATSAADP